MQRYFKFHTNSEWALQTTLNKQLTIIEKTKKVLVQY